MTDAPDAAAGTAPAESLHWSFFKACVAGFAMGLTVSSLFSGASFLEALGSMLFDHLAVGVMMITVSPALAIPARLLADLAARLGLPRGLSDVLIGAAMGSLMLLPDLTAGRMPGAMGWGFLIGGGFGGWVFWRGRGRPGAALLADLADAWIGRLRRAP